LIGFEPFGIEVFGLGSEFFAQRPVEEFREAARRRLRLDENPEQIG
jgi:hypothetical protein